jgi:hypothetical protein
MPKPSKRDQLVEATKELLWEVGYEAMSPRDIQARSAAKPGSLMAAVRPPCEATVSAAIPDRG